jgi:hypothetical protein
MNDTLVQLEKGFGDSLWTMWASVKRVIDTRVYGCLSQSDLCLVPRAYLVEPVQVRDDRQRMYETLGSSFPIQQALERSKDIISGENRIFRSTSLLGRRRCHDGR